MNSRPPPRTDPATRARPTARARGAEIETHVEQWLCARGLQALQRNYGCRGGEIDLIMQDGDTLVFVEVRYRRSNRYGSAAASVGRDKQARLIRAAQHFLMRHRALAARPCRFDVVAVSGPPACLETQWISAAFSA